ncbi:MAG: S-methyl-5'-thioinosine phosphorylase [Aquificaceae bacterium]
MLGVIGGSGLYSFPGAEIIKILDSSTPFGKPSGKIYIVRVDNSEIAFLARHSEEHSLPPHRIPHRANLWALKTSGVDRIIAISAVGAIDESLSVGEILIPEDIINFSRHETFYEGTPIEVEGDDLPAKLIRRGAIVHVDCSDIYCKEMRESIKRALKELGTNYQDGGIYACTHGPRFETPAEIRALEKLGASVVGMTGGPEATLARELGICYAKVCIVTNLAAGKSRSKLTATEVTKVVSQKLDTVKEVIFRLSNDSGYKSCQCEKYLQEAHLS